MPRRITIVMYHYVRDLARSRFPGIKGLTVTRFRNQLDYIRRFYTVITMEDLVAACIDGMELPHNGILLTFDDGFRDHFENVFPLLHAFNIQGSFFPSSQPVLEKRVLDVHKIHFVLASVRDVDALLAELKDLLRQEDGGDAAGAGADALVAGYEGHRYDGAEVTAFKRLLQRDLPRQVRERLVSHFFRKYVTEDETAFSRELYLTADQMRRMRAGGMYFGCHGHAHLWLDRATAPERGEELDGSLALLDAIGQPLERWVMCYPYGGFAPDLVPILRGKGCAVGLLADPGLADLDRDDALALPRLDTNDLPSVPDEVPSAWTRRAIEGA